MNQNHTRQGLNPVFMVHPNARILIIGQASGLKTQEKFQVFKDKSDDTLRE